MTLRRKRLLVAGMLAVAGATTAVAWVWPKPRSPDLDRDNHRWVSALRPYPGRYDGLNASDVAEARRIEAEFRRLLDALTAIDGLGGDHGRFHQSKEDQEQALWKLLERLPKYPAAPDLLLSAIDDVYLAHHGNGWWGYWWHWPYLDCSKAVLLSERLARDYPGHAEEALWSRIHCHRIKGWNEPESDAPTSTGGRGPASQLAWTSDPEKVRSLCRDLLAKFPQGKYAVRANQILNAKDPALKLPGHPVMGRTRPSPEGLSMTVVRHDGPDFVIDRAAP